MAKNQLDILIVGGGIMGCSVAYHLMKLDPGLKLAVVERDPTYQNASTTLSMGGVRVQFSLKENILISLYTLKILERFAEEMAVGDNIPDVGFRRDGYLFLIDPPGEKSARSSMALQKELGGQVEWWLPPEIKRHYPLINPSAFAGGTYGPADGYLDPYNFLMSFKTKAQSLGAQFLSSEAVSFQSSKGKVSGVKIASGEIIESRVVVNAAGAWAAGLAKSVDVVLPVEPVKRQVFVFEPAVSLGKPLPLVICPSGFFFRSETGGLVLAGRSFENDKVGFNFDYDRDRFENVLWPELVEYAPAFEKLKLVRGWAGLYDVNRLDGNAILGEWPELKGLFLICGFSGHGLMQSPAAGRYVAELILGETPSLDLSIFNPGRILQRRPLTEKGIV
jgi:FAD-dependent oxidoreductase domain-containing protein 1